METSSTEASHLPLIALGALILFAIVVGVAMGLGGAQEFDDGTPEAALQEYLDAAVDGDSSAVLALLTSNAQNECEDRVQRQMWSSNRIGFRLESMDVSGSTASAVVDERWTDSGPFGGSGSSGQQEFELTQDGDGNWRIAQASWPWPVSDCLRGLS